MRLFGTTLSLWAQATAPAMVISLTMRLLRPRPKLFSNKTLGEAGSGAKLKLGVCHDPAPELLRRIVN
jgi:hypothetical protein